MKKTRKKINKFSTFYEGLKEADKLKKNKDSLSAIVCFFKAMSVWHNGEMNNWIRALKNGNGFGQNKELLEKLERFKGYVVQSSYKKKGLNRTKDGEVGDATIFLEAPAHDIPAQSVLYWKEQERNKGKSNNCKRVCDIICQQANDFLYLNMIPVIRVTEKIMEELSK